ncbi:MAG: PAAR domain-containing protein [Acinetobacter sp.]
MKPIIVQGCKTDHGGVVLQGHPTVLINGIGMAAKGYMVSCPRCQGTFPIIEGLESYTLPNDLPVALAGMKTACGATLLPSTFLVVVQQSSPFGSRFIANPNDDGEDTVPAPEEHSGRFQLIDQNTGKPIANRRVRVVMADGTSTIYASNDDGFTDWIYTPSEEEIHLYLVDELSHG